MIRTGWGLDFGWSDHDAIVVGRMNMKDEHRRIFIPWWWHHRHLDIFKLSDVVRVVREVFPPGVVVADDGGGHKKTMMSVASVLQITLEDKPRDLMLSVGAINDEFRTGRLQLALRDEWTPKMLEVAAVLFATEPARLEAVVAMLTNKPSEDVPKNAPLDLRKEFEQVHKTIHPITKKVTIGHRKNGGKHSDGTEACRYVVEGLTRAPAQVRKPGMSELQTRLAAMAKRQRARGPFSG